MGHWTYAAILGGCLLVTLPLELVLKARVYRRWRLVLRALWPVALAYVAWDLLGIWRDHWWYEPTKITGPHLGPMPWEELAFFVVVPLCGLLTYGAVGTVLSLVARLRGRRA